MSQVINGVVRVDGNYKVGFRMPDGSMLDLCSWMEESDALGIFAACLWLVTGKGREPVLGSSFRNFVERKLREARDAA